MKETKITRKKLSISDFEQVLIDIKVKTWKMAYIDHYEITYIAIDNEKNLYSLKFEVGLGFFTHKEEVSKFIDSINEDTILQMTMKDSNEIIIYQVNYDNENR